LSSLHLPLVHPPIISCSHFAFPFKGQIFFALFSLLMLVNAGPWSQSLLSLYLIHFLPCFAYSSALKTVAANIRLCGITS
jgi:hypothetical protein